MASFIINGYGSHMIILFYNLATENKIVLFRLPPNSTNPTQPLDVGVFQPFKLYHSDAIDKTVRLGDEVRSLANLSFCPCSGHFATKPSS